MLFPNDTGRKKNLTIMLKENLLGTEPLIKTIARHPEIVSEGGKLSSSQIWNRLNTAPSFFFLRCQNWVKKINCSPPQQFYHTVEGWLSNTETRAMVISLWLHGILPRTQWENMSSIKNAGIMRLIGMKENENSIYCILE